MKYGCKDQVHDATVCHAVHKVPSLNVPQKKLQDALLQLHGESPILGPDKNALLHCAKVANQVRAFLGKFRWIKLNTGGCKDV
eukprot:6481987-Amphidinium_carterae.1